MAELTADTKEKNGKYNHLVRICLDFYKEFSESPERKNKIDEAEKAREIYAQIKKKATFPWPDAYNITVPIETITIDNVEPRLYAGMVGKSPYISLTMKGMTEQDEQAEIIQDWFNAELVEVVKIAETARHMIHTILLDGTVYLEAEYSEDEKKYVDFMFDEEGKILMDMESGEPMLQELSEKINEGVSVSVESLATILHADDAENWEETDFIKIINPSYAKLQRDKNKSGYMNIGAWLLSDEHSQDYSKIEQGDKTPAQAVTDTEITGRKGIRCIECHIKYIWRKDKEVDESEETDFNETKIIATIAIDSGIIIRFRKLTDINFKNEHTIKRVRLFPELGRAYGTSMHTKLKSIQEGVSSIVNLALNIITVIVMPWYFYSNKAGLKGPTEIYPGAGIEVDDPSQIVFPKFNVNPQQLMPFVEMFMILWERLGSIGDAQIGRTKTGDSGANKTTATEFLGMLEEGNIKHDYQSKTFKEEFISLLRTIYDLYYKNMPYDYMFEYQGEQVMIPRAEMRRGYEFRLTGSTELANKMVQLQKAEAKYNILRQDPITNPMTLVKDFVHQMDPDANVDEMINPQINQAIQMLQQFPELMTVMEQYVQGASQAIEKEGGEVGNAS